MRHFIKYHHRLISLLLISLAAISCAKENEKFHAYTDPILVADNLEFAEGPAYKNGTLYFSDIDANKIYTYDAVSNLKIFSDDSGRANGLYFDLDGNIVVCETANKRIVSITPGNEIKIITEKFSNQPYNEPNDLWVSPEGNIYFTDPVFTGTLSQDGQHVYCVLASTGQVIRVADDLVKPNGITGNVEGSVLYIADYGASKIYRYDILADGTIVNRQLFASVRADGLDTDSEGNLYAASSGIEIFNPAGDLVYTIEVPGITTNTCIVEGDTRSIFITTHSSVYKCIVK